MKLPRREFLHLAAGATVLSAFPHIARAQAYPSRPITLVVPFAAGGPGDTIARIVSPHLSEALGQQVVVENVAGAGGIAGVTRVARATPDGYQCLLGNIGTHAYNQHLYKKPFYNPVTEFTAVGMLGYVNYVLVVRNSLPVNSLPEFIAYAKSNQDKMQYGSAGAGSATHISCVMLDQTMGTIITHVPYRGAAPALQDLMGGRIDFMCDSVQTSLSQIQGGTIKVIANLSPQRLASLPNLATAQEQGLADFAVFGWSGVFMPKGVDPAVAGRMNAAIGKVLDTPAFRQRFEALGLGLPAPEHRSSAYFGNFVAAEIEKWAGPIKKSGVSMD